ncbi:MAG: aldehyde dehydrogenase, partial [Microbacterium sp.]
MPQAAPASTAPARTTAPTMPEEDRAALDAAIAQLEVGSRTWSHLTLGQRARLLERVRTAVAAVAEEWADLAATSKGLEPGHPLRGEEWLSGPYATLVAVDAYRSTLAALARGASPLEGVKTDAAPGGRVRAHVFPLNAVDGMLLSGYTGEVWFAPSVSD